MHCSLLCDYVYVITSIAHEIRIIDVLFCIICPTWGKFLAYSTHLDKYMLKCVQAPWFSSFQQYLLQLHLGMDPAVEGRILYITLPSERKFTGMTKLVIRRWDNYPGLFSGPNGSNSSRRWRHDRNPKKERLEAAMLLLALKLENKTMSQGL